MDILFRPILQVNTASRGMKIFILICTINAHFHIFVRLELPPTVHIHMNDLSSELGPLATIAEVCIFFGCWMEGVYSVIESQYVQSIFSSSYPFAISIHT